MLFKKWKTVFFSSNADDYYAVKGKLINSGIKHKSKVESCSSGGGHASISMPFAQSRTYEIFVMEQDMDAANAVINCR